MDNNKTNISNADINTKLCDDFRDIFFTNYDKGLLRTNISETEIVNLSDIEKLNLYYICYIKAISLIPTIEMTTWINDKLSPKYDICGGAGNLGLSLGIPTTDSYFRLTDEFDNRMSQLDKFHGENVTRPDFTVCENTEKMTANNVARLPEVDTVIGSWILVQHPSKDVNEAIKLLQLLEENPSMYRQCNPSKKVSKIMKTLMLKGKVGVPNGIHMKGLLDNANLIFIGNFNIHNKTVLKELYSMYKCVTYKEIDLPFTIVDKQYLKGNVDSGFIKYFPKTC